MPIRFVVLDTGKRIAVNPGEDSRGNVAAIKVGPQLHGFVITRTRVPHPRAFRLMPHAATCDAIERPEKPEPDPALF